MCILNRFELGDKTRERPLTDGTVHYKNYEYDIPAIQALEDYAVIKDPALFIVACDVTDIQSVLLFLERGAVRKNVSIIICQSSATSLIETLVINSIRGTLRSVLITIPNMNQHIAEVENHRVELGLHILSEVTVRPCGESVIFEFDTHQGEYPIF